MKAKTITHKNLNNGTPTLLNYPLSDEEFEVQLAEIFDLDHYKDGRKKGVYVDIGANIGLTALYFKDYATKYYTIEPEKQCFEALKKNTEGMDIEYFNFAISPRNGEDYLWQTAKDSIPQTFFGTNNEAYGRQKVECKRLDTFFEENKIEHVDVLKIDTESSEYVILPSESFSKVAHKIDMIIGEAHYNAVGGIPELIPVILKEYGFKTKFVPLVKPNMIYKFTYTPEKKTYEYVTNTIFVATR